MRKHIKIYFATLASGIVDLLIKKGMALINSFPEEALLVICFESVSFDIANASIAYVVVAPFFEQLPVVNLWIIF